MTRTATRRRPLKLNHRTCEREAGVDEAGRGALAGPVVAAAVILPAGYRNDAIYDSKLLTARARYRLREEILEAALAWSLGVVSVQEIETRNILQAALEAMREAVAGLPMSPEHILVDGGRFVEYPIPYSCIPQGDRLYLPIAAASILAKTFRDDIMVMLGAELPMYDWQANKGYPTAGHKARIQEFGMTRWHRRNFRCY